MVQVIVLLNFNKINYCKSISNKVCFLLKFFLLFLVFFFFLIIILKRPSQVCYIFMYLVILGNNKHITLRSEITRRINDLVFYYFNGSQTIKLN